MIESQMRIVTTSWLGLWCKIRWSPLPQRVHPLIKLQLFMSIWMSNFDSSLPRSNKLILLLLSILWWDVHSNVAQLRWELMTS
uniref:Eukaryotic translation initiation factor 4g, putative n=1 Tax=Arundo donax TaxID=35708 RepID=A0A0A9CUY0_ARUDO